MMDLVSIRPASAGSSAQLHRHRIENMPVVVIALHEGCDCRCVMCDIWKIQDPREMALENLNRQLDSFERLGVHWIALTGGEPQRHSHFAEFTLALRSRGIRVTMLTAGLLLERDAAVIAESVDDVIVSLDGPPEIHDRIRRVPRAFQSLALGVRALKQAKPGMSVGIRCTVQRANHDALCRTVECAAQIGADSISFLAADISSEAFNRPEGWTSSRQKAVALDAQQVSVLEREIERLIASYGDGGFVVETAAKLHRIVLHFRAHLGEFSPVAPRCNAPWVSAVVEVSGDVRPCFFHPAVGNIRNDNFAEVVNGPAAIQFRANLDVSANPTCQRCVCSLYIPRNDELAPVTKSAQSKRTAAGTPNLRSKVVTLTT